MSTDAEITLAVEDALLNNRIWEALTWTYTSWPVRTPYGDVEVADKHTDPETDSYGDVVGDSDVWILFKLQGDLGRDPMFFKKFGTADSYGRVSWAGKFRMVTPKVKTVTVYEYE
jgi:hypothetical protein